MSLSESVVEELVSLFGANRVRETDEAFAARCTVWSPISLKARQSGRPFPASVVASPHGSDELSRLLLWANRREAQVIPIGGATATGGILSSADPERPLVFLDTSAFDSVTWSETAMTVTAGAGVVIADLEERLNAHAYSLGSLPQSARIATVGGAIATEAFGLFSPGYGGMRDQTVALEAVLPNGDIVQTAASGAASRTLHHLLIGAEGAFGIVTAATLSMRSLPEVRAWCAFEFDRLEDAADALRLIYRTDARPAALRLFDAPSAKEQFAISAKATAAFLLLGFEGSELVQTGQYQTAYAICRQVGGQDTAAIDGDAWYDAERYRTSAFAANGRPGGLADVISVYVSWPSLIGVHTAATQAMAPICSHVSSQIVHADAHGAALDVRFETGLPDPEAALSRHAQIMASVRQAVNTYEGVHVAHHFGIGTSRADWAASERGESQLTALRSLKAALDPKRILPEIR